MEVEKGLSLARLAAHDRQSTIHHIPMKKRIARDIVKAHERRASHGQETTTASWNYETSTYLKFE